MRKMPSKDMIVHVGYLDLQLAIIAQGVAWSPDVADDMVNRMTKLFDQSLMAASQYGLFESDEEEDDDYGPTPEKELINPYIVHVEDDKNVDG
jgi:hypothetical protein